MEENAITEATEELLQPTKRKRKADTGGTSFLELAEWINGIEEADETVRVHKILSADSEAPESFRCKYSFPFVAVGDIDGYEKADGSIVIYKGK